MMSFLFMFIFLVFLFLNSLLGFWILSFFLVAWSGIFLIKNFIFVDEVFLSGAFFLDSLSFSLIVLSVWVSFLMYMSSFGVYFYKNFIFYFSFLIFILCFILILTFSCSNLLSFYFYFEASLIPTLLIILGWGYQPERLQAGIYFLFYTLTASLPLLIILVMVFYEFGGLVVFFSNGQSFSNYSFLIFLALTLAFLVKMPMFFTHLWLPKAHVEAPVCGSMILAGILLKLGGYGFYRVLHLCMGALKIYGGYVFGLSVLGMMYVGFMCCRLNDLKALVAYSSVAHMGLVICGVFSNYFWGYSGGLMMMISHGLASSGLFCIVNMYYERSGSRSIFLNKGLILLLPLMSLLIFLLSAANMAAPPTINLMSEIFLMVSILKFDTVMLLFFPLASYMGAVFTLFMFSYSQHGSVYTSMYSFLVSNFREFHTLVLHIIPINFLILKPEYFLSL